MSKALIAGINQVATDKGLEREVIFNAIEAALISAYKRNYGSVANVSAEIDRTSGEMKVFAEREVVEEVMNPNTEIRLEEAKKIVPDAELGDVIKVESAPNNFGRIAAQTAKQVILQRIREAERDTVYENFVHRVGELINAQVRSVDTTTGTVTVLLGEKHESLLPREEQIPTESLRRGDYVRLYVVDVHKSNRGPVIKLSRTHRNLLRRLMEQEIPEVREGTVEIKAIAREPGARSKVSVAATVPNVDPVGSCVGMRGMRIQNIVNELAGEKIDVVEWSSDLRTYIANALSPAKVQSVILDEDAAVKTAMVVVPDRQLSLAIGKEGQNARLAAKLTGWRIDIKSETEAREEGLDLLAAQQAMTSRQDLLSMAERILQSGETDTISEDKFRQAAEALQRLDAEGYDEELPETAVAWSGAFEDIEREEERDAEESQSALDAFERAAAAISGEEEPAVPSFEDVFEEVEEEQVPSFEEAFEPEAVSDIEEPEAEEELAMEAEPEEAGETPEPEEESGVVEGEELPEIITADMLRQRMAQRRQQMNLDNLDDIEVPEELLAGFAEEDVEEDLDEFEEYERKRNKSRRKEGTRKGEGKKKRSKRRRFEDEIEEFEDF